MVSRILKVDPFDLVVFGGTGDLAYRKLFPALFRRFLDDQFSAPTRIIGVSRRLLDSVAYRATIAKALQQFSSEDHLKAAKTFFDMIDYVSLDIGGEAGWDALADTFSDNSPRVRAFYLATAPDFFGRIAKQLAAHSLVTPTSRIIVEKPIGRDSEFGRAHQ